MAERIIVIGGGICGLGAAHALAGDSYDVTLIEASNQLGGLGTFFKSGDQWVDKHYHCHMPSDDDLIKLINEVGLEEQLYWKKTRMGFIVNGKRYPFNTALDLLRFNPITLFERIRFGFASLFIRQFGVGQDLDNTRIEDWLSRLYGRNTWKNILKPLFRSKFGSHAGNLPALYIWQRLGREKNTARRGYLRCGLKGLIDTIEEKILARGGRIYLDTTVERISKNGAHMCVQLTNGSTLEADRVLSTIPVPMFSKIIEGSKYEQAFRNPSLPYQGVVNALFFLSRPLDNLYWSPVLDSGTEFDGVVEMTELVNIEQFNQRHLVYVMKYCDRSSPLFSEDIRDIGERWKQQLLNLYSDLPLQEQEILEVQVFKAPFVEPIYPLGYSKIKPNIMVGDKQLLLATTAQAYPNVTSWNTSVGLANKVVDLIRQSPIV